MPASSTTARRSKPVSVSARKVATSLAEQTFLNPIDLPDRYGLRITGDCMTPVYQTGGAIWADKNEPVTAGDDVVIFLTKKAASDGRNQVQLKRLVTNIPGFVTFPWRDNPKSTVLAIVILETLNPSRQFSCRCSDILAIHKCMGRHPGDEGGEANG